MQVFNIRQLKNNPSTALRQAKQGLVMITNRDQPDSLVVGMEQLAGVPNLEQVRLVLGISLFRDKQLSLMAAAKVADKPLSEMISIVSEQGIPVVDYAEEEANIEADFAEKYLSKPTGNQAA